MQAISKYRVIVGALFALAATLFIAGGAYLAFLGGTWYYLIAGLGLGISSFASFGGKQWSLTCYAFVLAYTLIWAVYEVQLDGWQLEPRLLVPTALALLLLIPAVARGLVIPKDSAARDTMATRWPLLAVSVLSLLTGVASLALHETGINGSLVTVISAVDDHDDSVADADWQFYGRTPRGDRFSPLRQVNTSNVSSLKTAWQTQTGDTIQPGEDAGGIDAGHEFNFEATPIKINDTLFLCTGHSWVLALDAVTGKIKWSFNPHADTAADVYLACRGVSYYEAPADAVTPCPRRIISPVLDARVVALNADTGIPCEDFGQHGFISLTQYLGHVPAGFHFVTSPPLVVKDRVILGGWIQDNQAENEPSGAVRAFSPLTGALIWAWDVGKADQVQHPSTQEELTRGTPNAWGVYTADVALGMVYLPMGNATPDYFGGHRRPFDEKYSAATVALDIATGAPRWVFQNVHHDLWDMDVPIGPSLVNLPDPTGKGTIPALIQSTKRGEFFMLDRRTGEPISRVVERAVPQGAVPGDWSSPTQAYSPDFPSMTPRDLTETHLWGATPFDQLVCRIEFKKAIYKGQFTPPGLNTTIVYPAFDGVIDWHGASIDPDKKVLIANSNYIPFLVKLSPRGEAEAKGLVQPWDGSGNEPPVKGGLAPQYGTPYVGSVHPWLNPLNVPCNPPPWGTLTAIDIQAKKIVWQHPIGTTRDTGPFGTHVNLPLPTGIFNIGGNLVTAGGLIFLGATADNYLRAIDESDGKELWSARLPAGGQATPMSYSVGPKQYVVIAAGGHGGLGTKSGDYVVAYALPN